MMSCMLQRYSWTNVAEIQIDKCCNDADGQMLQGYRRTNFTRMMARVYVVRTLREE
jgi:hypothetical protein